MNPPESVPSFESASVDEPWSLSRVPLGTRKFSFSSMVRDGLSAEAKWLDPIGLYDQAGSILFEKICAVEDYYVTRAERSIIEKDTAAIMEAAEPFSIVTELGSGSSEKTEVLLRQILEERSSLDYFAVDISESALTDAAKRLSGRYPNLDIYLVVAGLRWRHSSHHGRSTGSPLAAYLSRGELRKLQSRKSPALLATSSDFVIEGRSTPRRTRSGQRSRDPGTCLR